MVANSLTDKLQNGPSIEALMEDLSVRIESGEVKQCALGIPGSTLSRLRAGIYSDLMASNLIRVIVNLSQEAAARWFMYLRPDLRVSAARPATLDLTGDGKTDLNDVTYAAAEKSRLMCELAGMVALAQSGKRLDHHALHRLLDRCESLADTLRLLLAQEAERRVCVSGNRMH